MNKSIDLEYGAKREKSLLSTLEKYFKIKLLKTDKYNEFDYVSVSTDEFEVPRYYIELKSRRNTKNQYPTTMVGYNKFEKGYSLIKEGRKIYFVFDFTDQISYYQLSENTFEIKNGGRTDRGYDEIKKYVYIPSEQLINIKYKKY